MPLLAIGRGRRCFAKRPIRSRNLPGVVLQHHRELTRLLQVAKRQLGRDEQWLKNELKTLGYKSPQQVYLAFCSEEGKLTAYPMNREEKDFSPFD